MITRCFSSEMQGERELTYLTPQSANVTLGDKGHREDVRFNLESSSWLWAVRRKQTKQTQKKKNSDQLKDALKKRQQIVDCFPLCLLEFMNFLLTLVTYCNCQRNKAA